MYLAFSDFFSVEFNTYEECLNFAKLNGCAVMCYQTYKVIDDYRNEIEIW